MTAMIDHALAYAAEGRPVFPLRPGAKEPFRGSHAFSDATTDAAQIRAWWGRCPTANIGHACGAFVMIDIDVKDGKHGDLQLLDLLRELGPMPWTRQVWTPSGGYQFHYRAPFGVRIRRRCPGLAPWIDVLGAGGYTVLPPSETPKGRYTWCDDGAPLAELSGRWLDRLVALGGRSADEQIATGRPTLTGRWGTDTRTRAARALAYVEALPIAVSGQGGHAALWRAALALVRGFELPRSVALEFLAYYSSRCSPPWSARELEHKLDAAERAETPPGYLLQRASA